MARKRMVSVRLAPAVADQLDVRAAAAGQTRTEWIAGTLARAVLGSGAPQPVGNPVERPEPRDPGRAEPLPRDPGRPSRTGA